jgi:hypothetical protein
MEQRVEQVAAYLMLIAPYQFHQLVFADEIYKDERNIRRLYGRAREGAYL